MKILANVESQFINRSEEAEELSESGADRKSKKQVPNEKFVDGGFGDVTFFPGDFGMHEISDNSGDKSRNEGGQPKQVVVSNNKIGDNGIQGIVKNSKKNADKKITGSVNGSFDFFYSFVHRYNYTTGVL